MNPAAPVAGILTAVMLAAPGPAQELFRDARKSPMPLRTDETKALYPADMNGDGRTDLVVANYSSNWYDPLSDSRVLLNLGSGRLEDITLPQGPAERFVLAVGDLDGDGDEDVLHLAAIGDVVGVGTNDGQGNLTYSTSTVQLLGAHFAALADFDGDGDLDLCASAPGVRLYRNDGALVFTELTATHLPPLAVGGDAIPCTGDVDNDGDLDLVLGDTNGQNLLLLNDGQARFTDVTATHLATASDPTSAVLLADLDADADLDLLVGNFDERPTAHWNAGTGAFTTSSTLDWHRYRTVSLAADDVDGDGDTDVVLGLESGGILLLNQGAGTFAPAPAGDWEPGLAPVAAAMLADMDGDGDLDLAAGHGAARAGLENQIFFNDGAGHFAGIGEFPLPASFDEPTIRRQRRSAAGDLDGDGDLDVLDTAAGGTLWRNDGWGQFTGIDLLLPVDGEPELGDLDGDGDLDAVLVNELGCFHVLLNPGDGWLWPATSWWLPPLPPDSYLEAGALGDLDGDGDLDVILVTQGLRRFPYPLPVADALWLNDGTGQFRDASHLLGGTLSSATDVAIGDIDGDGDPDIVTAGGGIYLGQPGVFGWRALYLPYFENDGQIALADLDGDGALDLVCGNACGPYVCYTGGAHDVILWNDGTGGFAQFQTISAAFDTSSVAVGDVDGDGDLDIAFGRESTCLHCYTLENELYLNDGGRNFRKVGGPSALEEFPYDADSTVGLVLADGDGDGDADLLVLNRPVDAGLSPRSKVYVNLLRHLHAPYLARLGRDYPLQIHGATRGAAVFASVRPGRVPVPPFGVIGLAPGTYSMLANLAPPASGRRIDLSVPVPPQPALAGMSLYLQALVYGPNLLSSRLTNRVEETLLAQ